MIRVLLCLVALLAVSSTAAAVEKKPILPEPGYSVPPAGTYAEKDILVPNRADDKATTAPSLVSVYNVVKAPKVCTPETCGPNAKQPAACGPCNAAGGKRAAVYTGPVRSFRSGKLFQGLRRCRSCR